MREQAIRRMILVGLLVSTVSTSLLAAPPRNTETDDAFVVDAPEQSEPPQASAPPARAKVNSSSRPSTASRSTGGWGSLLFFNPRNPRNVPKSPNEAPSGYMARHEAGPSTSKIAWEADFKVAQKKAVASRKPLLLVFGASWCGPCRKMEREVLSRPEIVEQIQHGFVVAHLDADQYPSLTELLDVERIPAILVLNNEMEVVKRLDGFQSARNLTAALKSAKHAAEQKVQPASLEETEEDDR